MVDGPFSESKELVGGFWIWDCKSEDDAKEWLKRVPNPDGSMGTIEGKVASLNSYGYSGLAVMFGPRFTSDTLAVQQSAISGTTTSATAVQNLP